MLELKSINLALGKQIIVRNFDLKVEKGEIATIMGASGAGKSSLLAFIAGSLTKDFTHSGDIILNGRLLNPLAIHQRRVGFLFQDSLLFPHLNVGHNLAFALPANIGKVDKQQAIMQALQDCDMADFAHADIADLSGGQRARIALMRALLAHPQCLLLDEPFSKLDSDLRAQFRKFVFCHIREKQLPAILVTHDRADATDTGGDVFNLPIVS